MRRIKPDTRPRPDPQQAHAPRIILPIQVENADRRVIKAIADTRARRKIIQLLRDIEIPRVENHAKHPTRHAKVAEEDVVFAERVGGGDAVAQAGEALVVGEEVEQAEEHAEGLLHAQEAVEGPFAVELEHGLAVGRVAGFAGVGDDVLACVVALGWAVPEEEPSLERCCILLNLFLPGLKLQARSVEVDVRIDGPPSLQLDSLHCCTRLQNSCILACRRAGRSNLNTLLEVWQSITQRRLRN